MRKRIAVIGSSAAGLFAGVRLVEQRHEVRVFERSPRIDPAPRTLIVTSKFRDILGSLGEGAISNEIRRFDLYANGRVASIDLKRPDLIIERSKVIRDMAAHFERQGGEVNTGMRFVSLDRAGARTIFATGQSQNRPAITEEADVVIGADGVHSKVARSAGWSNQPTVPLLQAIVDLPKGTSPHCATVWFRPEDTRYFYWMIPESSSRAAIGVIGEDSACIRQRMDRFLEEKGWAPREYQAAVIPAYDSWRRVHRRIGDLDVYLVGDAAAQVKVSTVGGMVTGFRGAAAVVEAISGNGKHELRSLKWELNTHLLIRKALHRFSEDDYSDLLGCLDGPTKESLALISRDDGLRALLRFCRLRPAIILRALRGLLLDA
ncbi:MAG: NAD(P)/FAD-dependent oxidoreductase [Actinobacteria bacterium]|nr:NAD(P)/FAD-dependent oxidoreductase [Actinomycetota bacterium]